MAQPSVIVFSASNVDEVPMLPDNNAFTGNNTYAGTETLNGATVLNGALSGTSVKDEGTMVSNSATAVPTQQSVKAYADNYMNGIITNNGEIITNGGDITWRL